MEKRLWLILLIVVLAVIGWFYFHEELSLSPKVKEIVLEDSKLSEETLEKISIAKEKIFLSDGHDYSELYNLLELHKDDIDMLFAICKEFNPIFCLKKASEQSPELREEICEQLVIEIEKKYGDRINAKGHETECLSGIPQMVY
ncbi:MAG: hypothetical protein ABIH92_04490 [Nanoarchaeota archaeon]